MNELESQTDGLRVSPDGHEPRSVPMPRDDHAPRTELPLVTVVVVNYNYGRFLRDAVESVFGQTYPNVECIVVDNASTDVTPSVLAEL